MSVVAKFLFLWHQRKICMYLLHKNPRYCSHQKQFIFTWKTFCISKREKMDGNITCFYAFFATPKATTNFSVGALRIFNTAVVIYYACSSHTIRFGTKPYEVVKKNRNIRSELSAFLLSLFKAMTFKWSFKLINNTFLKFLTNLTHVTSGSLKINATSLHLNWMLVHKSIPQCKVLNLCA